MDGFTDSPMRALQGEFGAFTFAVSEFIRVSASPVPAKVFQRDVPELLTSGKTVSGLPVQVQILGGDPLLMAESARLAVEAGAESIDINFGCPAPVVNRRDGGATILKHPERIRDIVKAVREALPYEIPVSAKLRLGWSRVEEVHKTAAMAAEGGADWITVHARTKEQRYRPPVDWQRLGLLRKELPVPLVANGDIWTLDDFRRCRDITGCEHFMLGRGVMADPKLARAVARELGILKTEMGPPIDWYSLVGRLSYHCKNQTEERNKKTLHRLKQWLNFAARFGNFQGFEALKRAKTEEDFFEALGASTTPGRDGDDRESDFGQIANTMKEATAHSRQQSGHLRVTTR
jgi:tRNA-dihydrouridine synthase C